MADDVIVTYPLPMEDNIYRGSLCSILEYTNDVHPSEGALSNFVQREYDVKRRFATRGITFLETLQFLKQDSTNSSPGLVLGPAGRRFYHQNSADVLFCVFKNRVDGFSDLLTAISVQPANIEELLKDFEIDETNLRQRLNWLRTMDAAKIDGEIFSSTSVGDVFLKIYTKMEVRH